MLLYVMAHLPQSDLLHYSQTFYVEWIRNRFLGKMDMTLRKEFY